MLCLQGVQDVRLALAGERDRVQNRFGGLFDRGTDGHGGFPSGCISRNAQDRREFPPPIQDLRAGAVTRRWVSLRTELPRNFLRRLRVIWRKNDRGVTP